MVTENLLFLSNGYRKPVVFIQWLQKTCCFYPMVTENCTVL